MSPIRCPRDQRHPPSSSCCCPSALLWEGQMHGRITDIQKRRADKTMEKKSSRFINQEIPPFKWENTRQSTAASIPSPFLCPFLAAVTTGQQAGWMLDFAHCKCSSPLWTSKVKIVRDLWLDSSVFQMGKAFNCFQPGARAVPVTMKWKALHPVLTSHSSLVLSSLPCLAFAFFIL